MRVLDLFSGIGGFSIGLEKSGMETVAFCEIDEYAKKVLKKHWSDVPIYDDVKKLSKEVLDNDRISVDVICGGFPCQDISVAGVQKGIEGKRSGLWGEFARLIDEIRPKYAIVENVPNLLSGGRGRWFGRVLGDLAEIGYDAEWHCISASELGAHHHRDRVWIISYPQSITRGRNNLSELSQRGAWVESGSGSQGQFERKASSNVGNTSEGTSDISDSERIGQSKSRVYGRRISEKENKNRQANWLIHHCQGDSSIWHTEPNVGRVAHGIPLRSHRLRCLGNAVVPQIPELIGKAIMDAES